MYRPYFAFNLNCSTTRWFAHATNPDYDPLGGVLLFVRERLGVGGGERKRLGAVVQVLFILTTPGGGAKGVGGVSLSLIDKLINCCVV